MGVGDETAQKMSFALSQLAVNFDKAMGGGQEKAAQAISMALMGNVRGLRDYKIKLDDKILSDYADKKGIDDKVKSMSDAQKAFVIGNFLLDNTAKIQAEANKNTGDFRDRLAEVADRWKNVEQEFGKDWLGPVAGGLGLLADRLNDLRKQIDAVRDGWNWLTGGGGKGASSPAFDAMIGAKGGGDWKTYTNADLPAAMGPMSKDDAVSKGLYSSTQDLLAAYKELPKALGDAGTGSDKAAEKLKQIKAAMDELARTYRDDTFAMDQDVKKLDESHTQQMESIRDEMRKTADDIGKLREEQDKLTASWVKDTKDMNRATADLLLGEQDKIDQLIQSRDDLMLKMEATKSQGGSISVKDQEDLDRTNAQIAKEQAGVDGVKGKAGVGSEAMSGEALTALGDRWEEAKEKVAEYQKQVEEAAQSGGSVRVGLNAALDFWRKQADGLGGQLQQAQSSAPGSADTYYETRKGQTDVERKFSDSQDQQAQKQKDYEQSQQDLQAKLEGYDEEAKKLKDKQTLETEAYQNSRVQMEETRIAMQGFGSDFGKTMKDIDKVTDDTVKSLKDRLQDLKDTISQIDAVTAARSDLTGGGTVAQRRAARLAATPDSYLQERASGGYTSGLTLVGEKGPELIDARPGTYVHNNRDTQKMLGGGSVNVNFPGMVIQKTADAYEVVKIVAREIQKAKLQAA
jgi:hypothetical protein